MITIPDWPREGRLGEPLTVPVRVDADVPLTELTLDLLGDGEPGVTVIGVDLRPVRALAIAPLRRGRFGVQVRAEDACGRTDATGRWRPVEVR